MGNWLEQPSRRARFRLLQMIFVGTTFDFLACDMAMATAKPVLRRDG